MRTVALPLTPDEPPYLACVPRGDGTATLYDLGDEDLLPPRTWAPRRITAGEFRDLFTTTELIGINQLAYGGDATAQLLLLKITTASAGIDLDSPEVAGGLDYLVAKGRLAAGRLAEILA